MGTEAGASIDFEILGWSVQIRSRSRDVFLYLGASRIRGVLRGVKPLPSRSHFESKHKAAHKQLRFVFSFEIRLHNCSVYAHLILAVIFGGFVNRGFENSSRFSPFSIFYQTADKFIEVAFVLLTCPSASQPFRCLPVRLIQS